MRRWGEACAWSVAAAICVSCSGPAQRYPLEAQPAASSVTGSLQVERIEGGHRLVIVELEALPPPEKLARGSTEYVVWLDDLSGASVRAGTLRYDRTRQSGNLMATTALPAFTVRVTAEGAAENPSSVLVAERRVLEN